MSRGLQLFWLGSRLPLFLPLFAELPRRVLRGKRASGTDHSRLLGFRYTGFSETNFRHCRFSEAGFPAFSILGNQLPVLGLLGNSETLIDFLGTIVTLIGYVVVME
jgi:hypothetical protein